MIDRILILDTETGGLDDKQHPCIEVAVNVYSLKHQTSLACFSALIKGDSNEAQIYNNIKPQWLDDGYDAEQVWTYIYWLAKPCDAIISHRIEFDRRFVHKSLAHNFPWVCSKVDIEWPLARSMGEHLVHLALAHGVPVYHAHRAMSDVDTLTRLFARVIELGYDIQAIMERAMRPKVCVRALVSFENKNLAKERGFLWNPNWVWKKEHVWTQKGKVLKESKGVWWRNIPEEDIAALPFKVEPFEVPNE